MKASTVEEGGRGFVSVPCLRWVKSPTLPHERSTPKSQHSTGEHSHFDCARFTELARLVYTGKIGVIIAKTGTFFATKLKQVIRQ